ncbi:DUF6997 domain-containing protein [Paenibacillus sp. MMO-177]|uniref:DUF6997 domain-containing protein n=1 Tax=Paenibacillus sp. MMO-177 TaxID=3081289 RepID=UPI00301A0DA3
MRLGQARSGKGTQFALVKVKDRLEDFFLMDYTIFNVEGTEFISSINVDQLKACTLLPSLTEKSLVNLGFSSGLISFALGFDVVKPIFPPANYNSTFTFNLSLIVLLMNNLNIFRGQVEIDAMFIEKRDNRDTLFVIEVKSDSSHKSLAKHKLLYPVLGVAKNVPNHTPTVPVYVKVLGIHFHIVECSVPDPRVEVVAITVKNSFNS